MPCVPQVVVVRGGTRLIAAPARGAVAGSDPRQKVGIVTETKARSGSGRAKATGGNPVSRFFGAISLFVRQILDELRKVVRPTGPELVRYTTVVVVFVLVIMGIVSALDFGWSKLVSWAFVGS